MPKCILYLLAAVAAVVMAGHEHSCSYRDYQSVGRSEGMCGSRLSDFVGFVCDGRVNTGASGHMKRDVSRINRMQPWNRKYQMLPIPRGVGIDAKEANRVLSVKKKSGDSGIVCECCINRCKISEFSQYCAIDKKRRRRNARPEATQEDVDRFYADLDNMAAETDDSQVDEYWYEEFEQQPIVKLLESYKQINIANEESYEESNNYENNMADKKAEQHKMSDFLRESLMSLLAKSEAARPVKSSPHLTAQENQDLRSLWELFENELEHK